ncbi:hypothetical protein Plhal304r1_c072g0160581 [Plasmopara halstedii]
MVYITLRVVLIALPLLLVQGLCYCSHGISRLNIDLRVIRLPSHTARDIQIALQGTICQQTNHSFFALHNRLDNPYQYF